MTSPLQKSRMWCVRFMRRRGPGIYLATRILPGRKRQALEALFSFCRDIEDVSRNWALTRSERRDAIQQRRQDVEALSDETHTGISPWFHALQSAYRDFSLQRAHMLRFIEGCQADVNGKSIETFAQLEAYAALVAGSAGRCIVQVLNMDDEESLALGERLGVAVQLTNILRNVREHAVNGRNYLPFGECTASSPSEVMQTIANRARRYYEESRALPARLPNDGSRAAVLTIAALNERTLNGLHERGFANVCPEVRA